MSAALDTVIWKAKNDIWCEPKYDPGDRDTALCRAFLRRFLDYVENSQQPISHDAMQTLRKHLEPKQCP